MVVRKGIWTMNCSAHRGHHPEVAVPLLLTFTSKAHPGRIIMCNQGRAVGVTMPVCKSSQEELAGHFLMSCGEMGDHYFFTRNLSLS